MWIEDQEAYPKIAKLGQLGTGHGSRDLLLNFGTSSKKLYLWNGTSYLMLRLTTINPIQKFVKLGQMETFPGSRDLFLHSWLSLSTQRL